MGERSSVSVDVRDMLCAQALAVVAQAVARLTPGQELQARYNADDVRRDVLIWANDQRLCAADHEDGNEGEGTLGLWRT